MTRIFELFIAALSGVVMFALVLVILMQFSDTKTNQDRHIACLELAISVENCNILFRE
tara:strand:- start:126 stop:299 length:174 start_codon:yes stop_codon:yes gene_type:complete